MQVKVCGIRTAEAAAACAAAGVDFAGLNFVDGARRAIDPETAAGLIGALGAVQPVGLFQNKAPEQLLEIAGRLGLRWVQLHGDESAVSCRRLAEDGGLKIIKAMPADRLIDLGALRRLAESVDVLLVDGPNPGHGQTWRWEVLATARRELGDGIAGQLAGRPFWVAGGLRPDNVGAAVRALEPAGVDSASGVERGGLTAPELIAEFCRQARAAEGQDPA